MVDRIVDRPAGARFLLGCPGGRSARTTYEHLARRAAERRLDLSGLVIVMMDEYVVPGPDGNLVSVGSDQLHSCRRFALEEIVGRLNAPLPAEHQIRPENLWLPDPADPEAYEQRLAAGIDVFLLASGASDGHVALNPPGAAADTRTRAVALPESTRRDNLATFPSFRGDLDAVPTHGVTVGIATIRERSREVLMLVHGEDKQRAVQRLTAAETYQPDWPATVLVDCRNPHLFVDRAAFGVTVRTG